MHFSLPLFLLVSLKGLMLTRTCQQVHISFKFLLLSLIVNGQEFKNALKDDTVDFSTYTANLKRKRPAPRKGRKSGFRDDEDDEEDDEDWTGGARRLSNGGRRGSYSRSRQR